MAPKQRYVPTRLMYRLICNLPELSIRICNPIASYCYLIGMNCGLKILIFHAVGLQIRQNITLVAYCPDRQNITLVAPLSNDTQSTLRYFSRGMPRFLSLLFLLRSISLYTTSMALRVLGLSSSRADGYVPTRLMCRQILQSAGIEYKDLQSD